MRIWLRQGLLLVVLPLSVSLAIAGVALAGGQPTLDGEVLTAGNGVFNSALTVNATCNPAGTSTITFTASGPTANSSGTPYVGTYTEQGTITIGPQTNTSHTFDGLPTGQVTSFSASFTIDSSTGQVSGTKTLGTPAAGETNFDNTGVCVDLNGQPFMGFSTAYGHDRNAGITANYQATITTPKKTYSDNGLAHTFVRDLVACPDTSGCSSASRFDFSEDFSSAIHFARPSH